MFCILCQTWIQCGTGMSTKPHWINVSFVKIGQWNPHFIYGRKWISVLNFQIYITIWMSFGIRKRHLLLHSILRVPWNSEQRGPWFPYRRKLNLIYACDIKCNILQYRAPCYFLYSASWTVELLFSVFLNIWRHLVTCCFQREIYYKSASILRC